MVSARTPINGGPTRKPGAHRGTTAASAGPGGSRPAGGAEHQRHAVGDAEADEREADTADRLADQQHRRRAGSPTQRARRAAADRADARVDAVADQAPGRHAGREDGEGERGHGGARAEVLRR